MKKLLFAGVCTVLFAAAYPALAQQDQNRGNRDFRGGGFSTGTVARVDAAQNIIEIKRQDGSTMQVVVPAEVRMMRSEITPVSGLKKGDRVTIQGVATAITAAQIQVREAPSGTQPGGPDANNRPNVNAPGGMRGGGNVYISGTIQGFYQQTDEQTKNKEVLFAIELDDKSKVVITSNSKTQMQKMVPVAVKDIKVGEQITAMGRTDESGMTQARMVILGRQPEGSGFRGFNFGGGFGGPDSRDGSFRRDRGNRN